LIDWLRRLVVGRGGNAEVPPETAPDPRFAEALEHHQHGRLNAAAQVYEDVLAERPDHVDALQGLGAVRLQQGDPAGATKCLRHAVALQPDRALVHANLGAVFLAAGLSAEAEKALRDALALEPCCLPALSTLARLLEARGELASAHSALETAVASESGNASVRLQLGLLYDRDGQFDEAERSLRAALEREPVMPEAHFHLGNLLNRTDRVAEAEACFRKAIELAPHFAAAINNLGNLLQVAGRLDEAEQCYHDAASLPAAPIQSLTNRADVLCKLGRVDEALACCQEALRRNPAFAAAHSTLGALHRAQGRLDDAKASFETAIRLDPGFAPSRTNLASLYTALGDHPRAEALYREALTIRPDSPTARYNLGVLLLFRGAYPEGFAYYESRFACFAGEMAGAAGLHDVLDPTTRWRGGDLYGKTVLVWTEQGLGDALMSMRFIPRLRERGASGVIVQCQPPLARVMQSLPGVDRVVCTAAPPASSEFDVHVAIMSLPHLIGLRVDDLPGPYPYLHPAKDGIAKWRARLGEGRQLCVGLAWAGSSALRDDSRRSIALAELAPILTAPGVRVISLQKDARSVEAQNFASQIDDWMDECGDLMDTAALVSALDLVISVDTAVAHLAGALGKPVWLLNRFGSEWRWGLRLTATPWYPSMTVVRQESEGDWQGVVVTLQDMLREAIANRYVAT